MKASSFNIHATHTIPSVEDVLSSKIKVTHVLKDTKQYLAKLLRVYYHQTLVDIVFETEGLESLLLKTPNYMTMKLKSHVADIHISPDYPDKKVRRAVEKKLQTLRASLPRDKDHLYFLFERNGDLIRDSAGFLLSRITAPAYLLHINSTEPDEGMYLSATAEARLLKYLELENTNTSKRARPRM